MTDRPTASAVGLDAPIDGDRLLARLAELATIGTTERGGVTREAYGPLDVRARDLVAGWMAEAGLTTSVDAATNLVGRRTGAAPAPRWLVTGSHLDTVVDAGTLDGAYGVVAAVEAADALRRTGGPLQHDLVVVGFANEEGARGTDGMVGSRALVGEVAQAELDRPDDAGVPLGHRLRDAGGDPAGLDGAVWDRQAVAAFVELHVEQGPRLASAGVDLGVVHGITGRQAVDIDVTGAANHAGTTPMELRRDALVAAAEVVLAVERLARDDVVRVATCGHLTTSPNVRNVVPGHVRVSAELRDQDGAKLAAARAVVEAGLADIAARRDVRVTASWGQCVDPIAADPLVVEVIQAAAERSGRPWMRLSSGAGHDAQILGHAVPIGMIFVPSVGGVSHSPAEHTEPAHLVAGAELLACALRDLDRRLAPDAVAAR